MPGIFIMKDDGHPEPMEQVFCKDETKELQDALEKNHDLLPGDQINPDDPCRWLLVKREMPVQDPSSGSERWSIDFLFVDQNATPTFVECKRFGDTRSRREVVGQVLEYAANGHYYWTEEMIRDYAEASAKARRTSLDEAWRAIHPNELDSIDAFLDRLEANLREGQIRIVFFMEEAPRELKSVVDFLNKQMERSEVLLVEARRYTGHGATVIVPSLFGFTEQARQIKRTVTVTNRGRRSWNWDSFKSDTEKNEVAESSIEAMKKLHDGCKALSANVAWGTGTDWGSFNPKWASICPRSVFTVTSYGILYLNFLWLDAPETAKSFRDKFKEKVVQKLKFDVPTDYRKRQVGYEHSVWAPKVDLLLRVLKELLPQDRRTNDR
jgi:hypothetical protein